MNKLNQLKKEIALAANLKRAEISKKFFKTGEGEYGFGDVFIGVTMPELRQFAKKYQDLNLRELGLLIKDKIHEYRMVTLVILIHQFRKTDSQGKKEIFDFYLKNKEYINNWDLVDISAPHIIGAYLLDKKRDSLYQLTKSSSVWDRRIAIISTFAFIRENDFTDTLKISLILINDSHDLIHKAVGWMLREAWKKNNKIVENFLEKNITSMPRTMLRYAIERMPKNQRLKYLKFQLN